MTDTKKLREGVVIAEAGPAGARWEFHDIAATGKLMREAADEIEALRRENAELLNAVKRLHPFASSYSTHHLRNPNDKLGEVLDLVRKWIV